MTSGNKPAIVRFYLDADVLGVAKVLAGLRSDITFPGDPGATIHRRTRPACPIRKPSALDTEWIPVAASEGWLIVTRDSRIQEHRAEIAAVRENNAKMVALGGDDARDTWRQMEVIFRNWRNLEQLVDEQGPFIEVATRSGLRRLSLD